ncbi:histidine kinase dimerization/phosphoacceptor domain -containing protein, partial [Methanobrevibacter sp. UBA313]|uniref:histidine kinase dimerization/phosphoacceptor domain -containing protein n=1 Tax=Methanobrevibacter sp. UBA313 TaxID=1915477 RepID=UPI0039B8AA05
LIQFTCFDISNTRRSELKAESYKKDLDLVQESSRFAIRYGPVNDLNDWSPMIYDILEVPQDNRANVSLDTILYNKISDSQKKDFEDFKLNPEKYDYLFNDYVPVKSYSGNDKFLSYHAVYMKDLEDDSKSRISSILQDLSEIHEYDEELKRSNEKLSELLNEKGLLLKGVHHQVKDNLQIILSLLNLDMRYNKGNPLETLINTKGYIQTISLMHEKKYESSSLNGVNIHHYLEDLSKRL